MIPRHYQKSAHDAAWHYLSNQSGEPLIVLPTGAGKSLVIAMLVEQARKFDARVIVLQHRKELIEQNAEKIQILLPDIKVGIYSAGLKRKEIADDVVVAGIQSIYRKANELGRRELILIDEVHLVGNNNDSMYGQFLGDIRAINPRARMIGLTATAFRTGEGSICGPDKMFQQVCYESLTGDLIGQGFLCPITNKSADASVDMAGVKIQGGEFAQREAEKAFDVSDKVLAACSEVVERCQGRKSILTFASGVGHAENITTCLQQLTGERVEVVTGETFPMERAAYLNDFKDGSLRWLVNCDVLTTGFDAPCIDAIAVLRATMSPGLFAQIVGRGLRKHESKTDCLILDFGGNIRRHGSLDMPGYGIATGNKKCRKCDKISPLAARECQECGALFPPAGMKPCPDCDEFVKHGEMKCHHCGYEWPSKSCPNCNAVCDPEDIICEDCGFRFSEPKPRELNHDTTADEESTLTGQPEPETFLVESVAWGRHNKRNAPEALPTLRVDYTCQPADSVGGNLTGQVISEWVCIEHEGYAGTKARAWWDARSEVPSPTTVDDAVKLLDRGAGRNPVTLTARREGKFWRILSFDFESEKPVAVGVANVEFDDDDWVPF